ncbi:MAG: hypothetical protein COA79_03755 [Planctomycetota bacterium]|nr:MAG: hypothetical protein COA79_03755 [Planctomycetota bacterium]
MKIQDFANAVKSQTIQSNINWTSDLDEINLGNLHGIVKTSDQKIWVQNALEDEDQSSLLIFDLNGTLLENKKIKELRCPHGLEIYFHPNYGETLLHTDAKNGLLLMDLNGKIIWHCQRPEFYQLRWQLNYEPSNSAISKDGRIFMADGYGSYYVTIFDSIGKEQETICGPSSKEEGITHPHGISIIQYDGKETLAITECMLSTQDTELLKKHNMSSCIKLFNLDGTYIKKIELDTISPRHIRTFKDGYLIPDFQNRLLLLDSKFKQLASIGENKSNFEFEIDYEFSFKRPHDCCAINDGTILVTEFDSRVSLFSFS